MVAGYAVGFLPRLFLTASDRNLVGPGSMATIMHIFNVMQVFIPTTDPQPATACLSPGTVVGISITIFLVSFSAGVMLAALITYWCVRRRGKSSGQQHLPPSEEPQPAPVYDEVGAGKLEMKENVAYGPVRH